MKNLNDLLPINIGLLTEDRKKRPYEHPAKRAADPSERLRSLQGKNGCSLQTKLMNPLRDPPDDLLLFIIHMRSPKY